MVIMMQILKIDRSDYEFDKLNGWKMCLFVIMMRIVSFTNGGDGVKSI